MHSEPFGDPVKIGIKQKFAKLALRRTDPKEVTQIVTDRKKDSRKTPGKQGPEGSAPEPNKINASTQYDFAGRNLTPYGGLLPVITMLEKTRLPGSGGTDSDIQANSSRHGLVPVRAGDRAGPVHRLSAAEPIAFHRSRSDSDGHSESHQAAGAIHLLEGCEYAAWECRPADAEHHANHARTGLGGGQCEVEGGHHRYRHDRAHALRPAD